MNKENALLDNLHNPLASAASFHERRQALLHILNQLRDAGETLLSPGAWHEFAALAQKFSESRSYAVFFGQFKRGKTTLLNAFLGEDLLPTGILPLTSIVTIVRYGARPCAKVKFSDASTRNIPVTELAAYITEQENPKNEKGVAEVDVCYPASRLRDGLCLVDTPGIGSVFEHNTRIAYQFAPRADLGIFVFSPESPLSQAELEFLKYLRPYVGKLFFVLNKADQVTEKERKEILDFARDAISAQLPPGNLRLLAVSAREALNAKQGSQDASLQASGLPDLTASLDQFLTAHGKELLLEATCTSLQRIVRDQLLARELERRALALGPAEITRKILLIEQAWQSLDQRHREAGYVLRGEVQALEAGLEEQLNEFVQAEAPRLAIKMQQQLHEQSNLPKRAMVKTLERLLALEIEEIFADWRVREETVVSGKFEDLTHRFSQEATNLIERIQGVAAEQFGFRWKSAPLPDRLTSESRFQPNVDYLMTWGLGQFPMYFPMWLFNRYLARRLQEACTHELYSHAGRLKADLGDRLQHSVSAYLRALNLRVEKARNSVLSALNQAATKKLDAIQATNFNPRTLNTLEEIDRELSRLQSESAAVETRSKTSPKLELHTPEQRA